MRTRIAIIVAAAVLAMGAGVTSHASRPLARLPDGTVVDLNTGIAKAPDGHQYKVSAAELATLRQQARAGGGGQAAPPSKTASVPAPATGDSPR